MKTVAIIGLTAIVLLILTIVIELCAYFSSSDTLYDIAAAVFITFLVFSGIFAVFAIIVGGITFADEYKSNGKRYLYRKAVYFCIAYIFFVLFKLIFYKEWIFVEAALYSLIFIFFPVATRGMNVINEYNISVHKKVNDEIQ